MHYFLSLLPLILFLLPSIYGHMYLSSLKIGGTTLEQGDCVRLTGDNSPIVSIDSQDMTCGKRPAAETPANRRCPIQAGSKIGLQWYHEKPISSDMIVEGSHKGPCTIYMAKDDGSNNPNWFKIWESGYDFTTQTFCVTTLIANRGLMEATIPADIEPGNYLIRGETIALHEAFDEGKAQPYVGCGELTVSGEGKSKPATVKLPGAYKKSDPGLFINIYNGITSYVVPGPAVYKSSSSSSSSGNGSGSKSGNHGGMSGGGIAVLIIFFIGTIIGIAIFGIYYYNKNGHIFGKTLPPQISKFIPSSFSKNKNNNNNNNNDRRDVNYVAFTDSEL